MNDLTTGVAKMDSNQPTTDKKALLKVIKIVRGALIAGPLAFMTFVLLLLASYPLTFKVEVLFVVATLMTVSAVVPALLSQQLFAKKPADWDQLSDDQRRDRLPVIVYSVEIVRGALLEGPTFFWILLIIMEDNAFGPVFAILLIVLAILLFPTTNRFNGLIDQLNERFRI